MVIRVNDALGNSMTACVTDGGTLYVRTGTQPASANTAATGTLLVQMDALTFTTPTARSKSLAATVPGTAVAAGTAGWGRYSDGTINVDGSVGVTGSGADFIISSTAIAINDVVTVQTMSFTTPA
jgi:glutamate synthase domain-containing protein 3